MTIDLGRKDRNCLRFSAAHSQTTKPRIPVLVCALLILTALNLFPQAETGQIVGTVSDPSGAAVPGAKVTVKSVATGAERSQASSDIGTFTLRELAARHL